MMKDDFKKTNEGWYAYEYPRAAMTTDSVIFGFDGQQLQVLLVQRGIEPHKGCWAFPGGFLRMNETIEQCARRELMEETSLDQAYMEPFGVFSDINRDPRGRVITTAFYALVRKAEVKGGDDAADAQWFSINQMPELAFDHAQIFQAALRKLREDLYFRPIGFELLPEKFSIPQLQRLYEVILGDTQFERRNFMKKMLATGILDKTDDKEEAHTHRAATLYTFNRERYEEFKTKKNFKIEF